MPPPVKRIFILSGYCFRKDEYSRKSSLIGAYTRKDQAYRAMLIICGYDGNLDLYNDVALPGIFMKDGNEALYRRICAELSKSDGRVQLNDGDGPFFNIWECPINHLPNVFSKDAPDSTSWWDNLRFSESESESESVEDSENET